MSLLDSEGLSGYFTEKLGKMRSLRVKKYYHGYGNWRNSM